MALLMLAFAITASAGIQSLYFASPLGLIAVILVYYILPLTAARNEMMETSGDPTWISATVLHGAILTFAYSLAWRLGFGSDREIQSANLFSRVQLRRVLALQVLAFCAISGSLLMSGYGPLSFLTTVNDAGYAYYDPQQYRLTIVPIFAWQIIVFSVAIIAAVALVQRSPIGIAIAVANFLFVLAVCILSGVRSRVLTLVLCVFLALAILAFQKKTKVSAKRALFFALGASMALVALIPAARWAEVQRTASNRGAYELNTGIAEWFDQILTDSAIMYELADKQGPQPTVSIVDMVNGLLPSFIAPNQPRAVFLTVIDQYAWPAVGAAVSSFAELVYNFGWYFSCLVIAILGYLVGRMQARHFAGSRLRDCVLLIGVLPLTIFIATRGYLSSNVVAAFSLYVVARFLEWWLRPVPKTTPELTTCRESRTDGHRKARFDNLTTRF